MNEMELHMNNMPDEALVAASRGGDRNAYAALVRRHARRVYAVCIGILGGVAESEDIYQETFVKGMEKIDTLRDGKQFAGWISQIARNLCRDHLRNQHRRRALLRELPARGGTDHGENIDLHLALSKLPEKYRLPLMLFYFDGRSSEKLAEELHMTQAGACTRLFRARNALRRILEEQKGSK